MKTYIPNPINTDNVELSKELIELTEQMARNVHEVWAKGRIEEGWTYGEQRDDQNKKHPGLIAYEDLSDSEREYDRNTAIQTIKLISALGFKITKPQGEIIERGVLDRIKRISCEVIGTMIAAVVFAIIVIAALIFSPKYEYDSWLIITAITLISVFVLCWLGYCCKYLFGLYNDSRKEIFETGLLLYKESARREEAIRSEWTPNKMLHLKLERKRMELEIAEFDRKIEEAKKSVSNHDN